MWSIACIPWLIVENCTIDLRPSKEAPMAIPALATGVRGVSQKLLLSGLMGSDCSELGNSYCCSVKLTMFLFLLFRDVMVSLMMFESLSLCLV